ncbi:UMP kinase [Candidatus Micrarchaeota archaeon]|nr:UMP kinase [Candidatus Micrarchaeota archaeon]
MKKRIIFSLGGSVVNPGRLNIQFITHFCELLKGIKMYKFGIVIGGGRLARNMVAEVRRINDDSYLLDMIGIYSTRVNAQAVLSCFAGYGLNVFHDVCRTVSCASRAMERHDYVFMGGTQPGHTTDYVSVRLAANSGALKVINISNVDAVYNMDPRKHKNAVKIKTMSHDELVSIVTNKGYAPSQNIIFDQKAAKLAKRHRIELHFISAKNVNDVAKALRGEAHRGTVVR